MIENMRVLPLPNSEEDVRANLMAIGKMLEENERIYKETQLSWESLSPDEKRQREEAPELYQGIKKCPNCGALPRVYRSMAEGFSFDVVIYCYSDEEKEKALRSYSMPCCANHNNEARMAMLDLRFHTYDELKDYWNGLLNKP